jgi:hypothetical protein
VALGGSGGDWKEFGWGWPDILGVGGYWESRATQLGLMNRKGPKIWFFIAWVLLLQELFMTEICYLQSSLLPNCFH